MSESIETRDEQPQRRKRRRAEPVFNLPPVVLALIGICVAVHLVSTFLLSQDQFVLLLINAAFIPIRYSGQFDLDVAPSPRRSPTPSCTVRSRIWRST